MPLMNRRVIFMLMAALLAQGANASGKFSGNQALFQPNDDNSSSEKDESSVWESELWPIAACVIFGSLVAFCLKYYRNQRRNHQTVNPGNSDA